VCHGDTLREEKIMNAVRRKTIASGNDWIQGTRNRDSIEYWAYLPNLPEGFNEEW